MKSKTPSDDWPKFTDSDFDKRHLTPDAATYRKSPWYLTIANTAKTYLGIAIFNSPKSVSQAGIYGAVIGYLYIAIINIFSMFLLLKARNRFKRERIVDFGDMGRRLYGNACGIFLRIIFILTNCLFLTAYTMVIGVTSD